MSDRDLAVSARAIVEATVLSAEPLWDPKRRAVFTYVTIDVERVHKGDVPHGPVVLKQIGGRTDRHETVVHGAPSFVAGHRALLFLNTGRDGALRVAHLALGHYEITFDAASGREVATRSIEAAVLARETSGDAITDVAFLDQLVASATTAIEANPGEVARYRADHERVPVLVVPPEYRPASSSAGVPHGSEFGFLNPGFRWFEPDSNGTVAIRVNGRRAPTRSKGVDETRAALAAWSNVAGSSLRLVYGGDADTAGRVEDGVSAITFGDPGDELDDPVNCSGVIAAGGVTKAAGEYTTIGGKRFARILEGDVVVNDGFECLLTNCSLLSEIVTHELGHVLGFGHSSERPGESDAKSRDATMYYLAHLDNRGASLREDDADATRFLYPGQSAPEPLVFVTESLPEARTGERYELYLSARGGAAPRSWSVVGGGLPAGLRLAEDGHLCGAPLSSGTSTVTIRVRDASGREEIREFGVVTSSSPAPYLAKVSYNPTSGRMKLSGANLSADAEVLINDRSVPAGTRVRFKASKGRFLVFGSPSKLELRPKGQNTVSVVAGGRVSNTLTF